MEQKVTIAEMFVDPKKDCQAELKQEAITYNTWTGRKRPNMCYNKSKYRLSDGRYYCKRHAQAWALEQMLKTYSSK